MPHLGEVRRICEIRNRKDRHLFIWARCLDCSRERWVPFIKGEPKNLRCCTCSARNKNIKGENHPAWKGGRNKNKQGYILIYIKPDDFFYPTADKKRGYILEHRLIIARHLGRNLHRWEIIHHKNRIRDDNRIENLQLVSGDKHKQITILENYIKQLEEENKRLRGQLNAGN